MDLYVNIVVCVPRLVLDGDFNAHSAWNSIREFLGVTEGLMTKVVEPRATSRACGATISATSGPDHSASTTSSYAASKRVLD